MDTSLNNQFRTSRHHVRHSLFLLVFRIFITLFTINTIFAALIALASYTNLGDAYGYALVFGGLWAVHTIQFIIETIMVITITLRWATNEYYITDRELFHYQGVWHTDERVYELQYIKSVKLYQSLLGRLFDYGTLTIALGSRGFSETLKIIECTTPKKYERLFRGFVQV